jgi:hypothetical protein
METKPVSAVRAVVYRPESFCEAFGIGLTKCFEEIKAGQLKAKKLGRATLIARSEGERWFDSLPDMVEDEV